MTITWRNILAIVFVAVALMLLAAVPVADTPKEFGFIEVEESTELIADAAIDHGAAVDSEGFQRLPESPGGAYAPGNHLPFTAEYAVLPGGAAGLAGTGIRGPTH